MNKALKNAGISEKYFCGHAIPFEKPDEESQEIMNWVNKYLGD